MLVKKDRLQRPSLQLGSCLLLRCMYWASHNSYFRKDSFVVTLIAMSTSKRPFYKGLPGFTRQSSEVAARDAESSVYYWWWAFMRLSPVFWYARTAGVKPIDPQIAETYDLVGDLGTRFFSQWWSDTGSRIFAESRRPAKVRQVSIEGIDTIELYDKSVLLEIPLTIRKETILKQVKDLLNEMHEGRALDLAATSQATLKLHTKRYRLRTMESEYWVLLYRLLYEDIEIWRIGDRLQVAPHLRVRGVDRGGYPVNQSSPFDKLHSLTGRYLYKARHMLLNAERGSFPNAEKIQSAVAPFGTAHDKDYRAATGQMIDVPSAWHKWLQDEFRASLRMEVVDRNHLASDIKLPGSKVYMRLPKFMDGTSDLIV